MSHSPPPLALLMDLDNTLYDYHGAAAGALTLLAKEAGVDPEHMRKEYGDLPPLPEEPGRTGLEIRRLRMTQLLQCFPETSLDPHYATDFYGKALLSAIDWFVGERESLHRLAGRIRVLIVTEGRRDISRPILETLGLAVETWPVLFTHDEGVTKRDGSAFRLALKWLSLPPEEAVVLGDNWTMDILGGEKAGIRQVWKGFPPLPGPTPAGFLGAVANLDQAYDLFFPQIHANR